MGAGNLVSAGSSSGTLQKVCSRGASRNSPVPSSVTGLAPCQRVPLTKPPEPALASTRSSKDAKVS